MVVQQLPGRWSARKPRKNRWSVAYHVLVKVWLALREKAEPRYTYVDGRGFIPSGVWVYKGTQRAITDELGINRRYYQAFGELASVGCIKKLRQGVYEIIRPPTRMDWVSLRPPGAQFYYLRAIMRQYVEVPPPRIALKPTAKPGVGPSAHAKYQPRDAQGRFAPGKPKK